MNQRVNPAPLAPVAVALLARADAELLAAQFSAEPGERFVHAHLAGLRAAAAVIEVRGRPVGRRAPRSVWEMLALVAPEVESWSAYFASGAALRRAVEAGRADAVADSRAEDVLCAAEDFIDEVGELLAGESRLVRDATRASQVARSRVNPAPAVAARTTAPLVRRAS